MTARRHSQLAMLELLCGEPAVRLVAVGNSYVAAGAPAASQLGSLSPRLVEELVSGGLLKKGDGDSYTATSAAAAWIARIQNPDRPFQAQHALLETDKSPERAGSAVLRNLAESPISMLARRSRGSGEAPWLAPHTVAAAERLRHDFELAQLQPRITANWSASVSRASGR
jgi:hypothetical protein